MADIAEPPPMLDPAAEPKPAESPAKPLPHDRTARPEAIGSPTQAGLARFGRVALVLAALACLVLGIWGGLVRLYWTLVPLTTFNVNWVTYHGPLMVCGFLGTLIGVERATALGHRWGYSGPLLTAAGAIALALGMFGDAAPLLIVLGSLGVVVATGFLFWRQPSLDLGILVGGAGLWLVGNVLWYREWAASEAVAHIIFWWFGFLLLTVFAERLELSRFLSITRLQRAFAGLAVVTYFAGLLVRPSWALGGERIMGASMVAMAVWLFRNDVARRTLRRPGLPRFTAICLLFGYSWLSIVGIGLWMHEPLPTYGVLYDSILHAFFLGFVVSMIFAHAPIILPSVVGVSIPFSRWLYVPIVLLHASLLGRIIGDILAAAAIPSWPKIHGWGGMFNAAAIGIYLLTVAMLAVFGKWRTASSTRATHQDTALA